ncbi:MAG: hypothetical protein KAS65_12850 [Candidatus Aminicenantes bacterium]|nr:hypothetical protein [Candidatus Aminicenantes bacterium]
MNETKKKKYEKPKLKKLSVIDKKVNIKGKIYSTKEILDYEVLNKDYISPLHLHIKENYSYINMPSHQI